MTDQLKPEDRALIERTLGEDAVPFLATFGYATSIRVGTEQLAALLQAARTEGRRSGEDGDLEDIFDSIRSLPDHRPGTDQYKAGCAAIDILRKGIPAPPVEAKPAEGDKEAHVAQIILGMMVPTDCFQTAEMRQRALATAKRLLAMTTREAVPARDEAALPEGWVAVPREPT